MTALGLPEGTGLRPADPHAAATARSRLAETEGVDPALLADPAVGRLLDAALGNSRHLADCAVAAPENLALLLRDGPEAARDRALAELAAAGLEEAGTLAAIRRCRTRLALTVGLADIAGAWDLDQVTAALSAGAEAAVQAAVACALAAQAAKGRLPGLDPAAPVAGSGFFVLGMGKLGARELNYSSDIDLIFVYDEQVFAADDPDKTPRIAVRVAQEAVRLLSAQTREGGGYRVDTRLRPDPSATPLAISVAAAETYYGSLGQNWERAAMIKARAIAGDTTAAEGFRQMLASWVWRRSLDFAAVQDIQAMKRQIGSHRGHQAVAVAGHDIKVGRGGIREIEFYAQTQQLIYGGRLPALRVPATLAALEALYSHSKISRQARDDLQAAYRFLRWVEHRLQMVADRQTQRLPEDTEGLDHLAAFLGYPDRGAFADELQGHLERVTAHYSRLFEEEPALSGPGNLVFTGTEDDPETVQTLAGMGFANPSGVIQTVRAWHTGRYAATRSLRAREILTELAPTLLQALAGTPQPDTALGRFDAFLGKVPAGVQLFALLRANPQLLDLVADVMGTAPALADYLARHPSRFDMVLTPDFYERLPERPELAAELADQLATAQDYQDVIALVRRWAHDRQFQAGIHVLRAITDSGRVGAFLADIAAVALDELIPRVQGGFAERHGTVPGARLAVLGMGRLGARTMTPTSDLDLIFVYDVPAGVEGSDGAKPLSPSQYYTRLVQRIITAITANTEEGRLYEVDMRLRPSGHAGPVATSLAGFARYQHNDAWTWEHMALTRARVVAGPSDLAGELTEIVRSVLQKPRDPDALAAEVAAMRGRIDRQYPAQDVWTVKYVRGGLVDAQFLAQYLQLRHATEAPAILAGDTDGVFRYLAETGLLAAETARELRTAVALYRRLLFFLRLTVEGPFEPERASPGLRRGLMRAVLDKAPPATGDVDLGPLEDRLRRSTEAVYRTYARFLPVAAEARDRGD